VSTGGRGGRGAAAPREPVLRRLALKTGLMLMRQARARGMAARALVQTLRAKRRQEAAALTIQRAVRCEPSPAAPRPVLAPPLPLTSRPPPDNGAPSNNL